ncbi:ABC transporter ATP-binding protein [Desulfothermobacter acidiphilus]|uniref:ABC transporter ATP-binding protein n=1 Tax=Desulfothermobacter acidiphilus TaxID=1938353 RepID=UPI003F8903CD
MKVLECRELAAGYGHRTVVLVEELKAHRGELICFLGPNGAGKSTLLKTVAGLLAPLGGAVYLKGERLEKVSLKERAGALAVVLTDRRLPALLTVFEAVSLGRHPHTGLLGKLSQMDERVVWESLRLVGAEELASRLYGDLSDGEKQKVLIARALAQEPEIMILDEPTVHLDLQHRAGIMSLLLRLCREKEITVFLSLHEVELALRGAAYVVLVHEGKALGMGLPEELLTAEVVSQLYGPGAGEFEPVTGAVELRLPAAGPLLLVVAGGGKGAKVMRVLAKRGYRLVCGVLPENDVDAFVARGVGASLLALPPFSPIGKEALELVRPYWERARAVIDTGFPLVPATEGNRLLLEEAEARGLPLFSLRTEASQWGERAADLSSLLQMLNNLFAGD